MFAGRGSGPAARQPRRASVFAFSRRYAMAKVVVGSVAVPPSHGMRVGQSVVSASDHASRWPVSFSSRSRTTRIQVPSAG